MCAIKMILGSARHNLRSSFEEYFLAYAIQAESAGSLTAF